MIAPLPALSPSPEVAVVVQWATIGALAGTAVAARRRARDPAFDAWLLTARWTVAGGMTGVLYLMGQRLGWW